MKRTFVITIDVDDTGNARWGVTLIPLLQEVTEITSKTPLEELGLSIRVFGALRRCGVIYIQDLLERRRMPGGLTMFRNVGVKSISEINNKLIEKGYITGESQ